MIHNIDGVEISIIDEWKNIAISLSGGADSAFLAYIICQLVKDNNKTIHIISHIRMWKSRPWQEYDSLGVYNYLVKKFPSISFKRYTNFIAPDLEWSSKGPSIIDEYGKTVSGDNIQIRAFSEYVCHYNKVDAYFNAVTRNPRDVDFEGLSTRSIELTENNAHLKKMMHMGVLACHPFRFIEKDWIIKQYKDHNLLDLLSITRSCEGDFKNLDYTSYIPNQSVPICNECFWCKERNWAINKRGITCE
jgi:hypothetical protein